jgi:DNA-binding response OmpR family regulator
MNNLNGVIGRPLTSEEYRLITIKTMYKASRVLIVDDDPLVREGLERLFREEGLQVTLAANGKEALKAIADQRPDALVLDFNMPDMTGHEVCRRVRADPTANAIAILILTGEKSSELPADSLNGGADDYVAKPFNMKELLARVRALLRRPKLYASEDAVVTKGPLCMDVGKRIVSVDGQPVPSLSPKEFDLLHMLLLNAPKVIDKNALALKVWGVPSGSIYYRTLDVYMRRIRVKIGPLAGHFLKTVPGAGFQWME